MPERSDYLVEGTYKGGPMVLYLASSDVGGKPMDLVEQMFVAMHQETWYAPHPQPQPGRLLDRSDPDDLLGYLRGVPGVRIDRITPPPPAPVQARDDEGPERIY